AITSIYWTYSLPCRILREKDCDHWFDPGCTVWTRHVNRVSPAPRPSGAPAKEAREMPRVTMVPHINVQITNRQRTQEWYENVLGARFRDRGPERNTRQLQLHIGNAEMHFTELDNPMIPARAHFALEVEQWDEMLAHLDALGVAYSRAGQGARPSGSLR